MEQFASVKRSKDGQPVRYLIVDDSVFARKNLARMIETFGGQVAAEAGDGLTDRKSTRLNSSHAEIYTLPLHDALPICPLLDRGRFRVRAQESGSHDRNLRWTSCRRSW